MIIVNLLENNTLNLKDQNSNDQKQKTNKSEIKSQCLNSLMNDQPKLCNVIANELEEIEENSSQLLDKYQQNDENLLKCGTNNNILKNIVKQFLNYLLREQNESLVSDFIFQKPYSYCKRLIKKYFKNIKYNNQCLVKLVQHKQYGKGLEYFLTFDAYNELLISKVQNLNQHLQSIQFIKKCCVNRKLLGDINFYKRRYKQQKNEYID
ncbi:hypothetical protein TTHERM_000158528 (macronuclear) [Tetrahymena thermophila SB210]|uniref:Uncharacterized protein n=1 Tax=Tetrahymena thermophila (strain SB210) TaxID=312017 RepID=W7XLA9_TETTS|nr:hypothetical protein TTHERM_000158528 [Tetrahymena thermophila SB210]EWS75969.1 hypothetical protein TTHERM_000158528 [Tetrahymena thermophila SB210]|eukprot:XP_012651487.1 hypothetical protein TTHERM_000158528 [Tetrahymena thermophila SB210]